MKHLEAAVRTVAATSNAQEVLKALLGGIRAVAPRGALYLVRPDGIGGWSSFGHPAGFAQAQRAYTSPVDSGWLGALAGSGSRNVVTLEGHGGPPGEPDPSAAETMVSVVAIQDKVVAIAVGQRASGEEPWSPHGLGTLTVAVELRLELSLAERRAAAAPPHAAPSVAVPETAAPRNTAPAPPSEVAPPYPGPADRAASEDDPRRAAARRFARLIATDIKLYNEQDVMLGKRDGNLTQRLQGSLERGRESFVDRHGDLGDDGLRLLRDAYVEVLADGDPTLLAEHQTQDS